MRRFANLFLIAFLVDGGLSVFHEIVTRLFAMRGVSYIRNSIAFFVILLAVPIYLSLGIDTRLPKKIFLPLLIFVFWANFFALPLTIYIDPNTTSFVLPVIQLILGIFIILIIRKNTNGSWVLTQNTFASPRFSKKNTILFFLGSIIFLPIVFFGYVYSGVYLLADHETAGFLRIGLDGLYLKEKTYRKDNKIIHLIGMIHVGEKEYYEDLSESLSSERSIILAEGVTDSEHKISEDLSIGKIADLMGLASQEKMRLNGDLISIDDLRDSSITDEKRDRPKIVRADIDAKDFSPKTVEFLNELGKHIYNSSSLPEGFLSFYQWDSKNLSVQDHETINNDILKRRNEEVLRCLEKALQYYDEVLIPWGAMHMPGIEEEIIKKGFLFERSQERLSIDFSKFALLFKRILEKTEIEPVN